MLPPLDLFPFLTISYCLWEKEVDSLTENLGPLSHEEMTGLAFLVPIFTRCSQQTRGGPFDFPARLWGVNHWHCLMWPKWMWASCPHPHPCPGGVCGGDTKRRDGTEHFLRRLGFYSTLLV